MKRFVFVAMIFMSLVCEAAAQSKFDIVYTSGALGSGKVSYNAVIINRQTNKSNYCYANIDETSSPWKIQVTCRTDGTADYHSHIPSSATVIARASLVPPPAESGFFIVWQVDANTGAGEACSVLDVTAPGEGCAPFTLQ